MDKKTIDQLDPAATPSENDLLMVSVNEENKGYVSKNMTLAALAQYVNGSGVPGGSGDQYEFYDTSETYDGVCDTLAKAQAYMDNPNQNILRSLYIGNTPGSTLNADFTKKVSKDCVVVMNDYFKVGSGYEGAAFTVKIDNKEINPAFFEVYGVADSNGYPKFYLKANQTLNIHIVRENAGLHVSIFPLASGGQFFIDTTHPEEHYKKNEPAVKDANGTWTYTAPDYPVLICGYMIGYVPGQSSENGIEFYINDDPCPPTRAAGLFLLRAHDELRIVNSGITYYCEYPLLPFDDESGSGSGGGTIVSNFGGYEMIDTSEDGDGIYDASTIQSYVSDRSKNYLWQLKIGGDGVYGNDQAFEKTLGKDCAIWIDDFHTESSQGETRVFLNENVRLYNIDCLKQSGMVQFYAKAGQKIKIINTGIMSSYIYIIPLASGGKYFFDTSDPAKFKRGVLNGTNVSVIDNNQYTGDNGFIERTDGTNHIKVTAPYPMLFAGSFILNSQSIVSTINEKNTLYAGDNGNGSPGLTSNNYVCLRKNDVFETNISSNTATYWLSYPLLESDNSSSSSGTPTCNCGGGAVIYDTDQENSSDLNFWSTTASTTAIVDKEFPCDCRLLFSILSANNIPDMRIDDQVVSIEKFPGPMTLSKAGETVTTNSYYHVIDIKKGQRVTIQKKQGNNYSMPSYWVYPLKQGGTFIDTSRADLFGRGSLYHDNSDPGITSDKTYVAPAKMLVLIYTSSGIYFINGKRIQPTTGVIIANPNQSYSSNGILPYTEIYLDEGDRLEPVDTILFEAYPLLVDGSGSVSETLTVQTLVDMGYDCSWNTNAGNGNIALEFTGEKHLYTTPPRFTSIQLTNPENDGHGDPDTPFHVANNLRIVSPAKSGSQSYWNMPDYSWTTSNYLNPYPTYEDAQEAILNQTITVQYA